MSTTETWEPSSVNAPDYWANVIGGPYTPAKLGKHQSSHPTAVKRVLDDVRGTETADVIVGLIFWALIVRQREDMLIQRIEQLESERRQDGRR